MRLERGRRPRRRRRCCRAGRAPSLATLLVTSLLVAWAGAPVGRTYALLLEGGFGSRFAWTETLTRATPLILTGLAAAVAFRPGSSTSAPRASSMPAPGRGGGGRPAWRHRLRRRPGCCFR
jgi:hypothetical protein